MKDAQKKKSEINIHAQHRKRMRESFAKAKLCGFSDVQILEYLLFCFNSQKDTNPIAHSLLNEFGSVGKVLSADSAHLKKVKGVGEITALGINFINELFRKVLKEDEKINDNYCFMNPEISIEYFEKRLAMLDREEIHAVLLDPKLKLIKHITVSVGMSSQVKFDARVLVENAIKFDASNVILAHNHPSKCIDASPEDIHATEIAFFLLQSLNINLRDHIIVGKIGKSLSFRKNKIMDPIINSKISPNLINEIKLEYGNFLENVIKY